MIGHTHTHTLLPLSHHFDCSSSPSTAQVLPQDNDYNQETLNGWWRLLDVDGDVRATPPIEPTSLCLMPSPGVCCQSCRPETVLARMYRISTVQGFITKDEFFVYALCAASRRAGAGLEAIFRAYDGDRSGSLDELEFTRALEEMGFGDVAHEAFEENAIGKGSDRVVKYFQMLKAMEEKLKDPNMRTFLMALAQDSALKVDTSAWSFDATTADEFRENLGKLLAQHRVRLADLFQQLDDDGSFSLNLEEFKDAMWEIGYVGEMALVEVIFVQLDADAGGQVGFDELQKWVSGREIAMGGSQRAKLVDKLSLRDRVQASLDADDDPWDAPRLQRELLSLLQANNLRANDVVRSWDKGTRGGGEAAGDALISSREYMVAVKKLIAPTTEDSDLWYKMVRSAAIRAFGQIDHSADGTISHSELCRWIDPNAQLISKSKRAAAGSAPTAAGRKKKTREPIWRHRKVPPPPCYILPNGKPIDQVHAGWTGERSIHLRGTMGMPGTEGPTRQAPTPAGSAAELQQQAGGQAESAGVGTSLLSGPSRQEPARPAFGSPSPPAVASMVAPFTAWDPSRWPGTSPQQPTIHQPHDCSSASPLASMAPHEAARARAAASPRPTNSPRRRAPGGANRAAPFPGVPSGQPRPSFAEYAKPTRGSARLAAQLVQLERERPHPYQPVFQANARRMDFRLQQSTPIQGSPRRAGTAVAESQRFSHKPLWGARVRTIVPSGETPLVSDAHEEGDWEVQDAAKKKESVRAHSPTFDSPPTSPETPHPPTSSHLPAGRGSSPRTRKPNGPLMSETPAWSIAADMAYANQRGQNRGGASQASTTRPVAALFPVGRAEVRTKLAAATALSDVALGRSFPRAADLGFEIDVDYRMRLRLGSGHHGKQQMQMQMQMQSACAHGHRARVVRACFRVPSLPYIC